MPSLIRPRFRPLFRPFSRRLARALAAALLGALPLLPVQAADPSSTPMLRIEPGDHTATVRRIGVDSGGRWLATGSEDKTVRLWSLPDGRPLAVLRPPIGQGIETQLYSLAMSPDGNLIAAAGWTQFNNGQWSTAPDGNTIYLFDRASGRLLRRMGGIRNAINHLAFSPDGSALAAAIGGNNGVRVYSPVDGRLIGEDTDYAGGSFNLHFSRDGRLATTSNDGHVRLYRLESNRLQLLAKRTVPGGKQPMGIRFSPDGQRLAVGYNDTPAVNVLDADTLNPLFAPNVSNVNSDLNVIAWSPSGRTLYAAGRSSRNSAYYVRAWSDGGNGSYQDWSAGANAVTDLAPLAGDRLLFSTAEPSWGLLDGSGQKALYHAPVIADYRDNPNGFKVSHDGSQVRFAYLLWGKAPAVFDIQQGALLGEDTPNLQPPLATAPGLLVEDWKNTRTPKLNGTPLVLRPNEMSRSVAILPDSSGLIIGGDWSLHAFDRNGKERWVLPSPGPVWGVNVSGNGRWVIAAYGDGTIRWHRASDGAEQLSFYPHPDKRRWVLWTPTGYYGASPGAEDLVGWHVNRGRELSADFYPASRFRGQFYRPDVIAALLDQGDEAQALRLADAERGRKTQQVVVANVLPPNVDLITAAEGSFSEPQLNVCFTTRSPADAPVTGVRVRINGQPAPETRNLKVQQAGQASSGQRCLDLALPREHAEIQVFAENRNGVSTPAVLRYRYAGQRPAAAPVPVAGKPASGPDTRPKLYVLAVGINAYPSLPAEYQLRMAAKDARDFADAMQKQKGALYRDVEVKLLTDKAATRDDVVDGLDWLQKEVTARDVGMLFLAGHGINANDGIYYFAPTNFDLDKIKRTGVVFSDIKNTLASLAGKAVFFIDTCHSGNVMGGRRAVSDISGVINELTSAENGVVVFSSATGREFALENPAWGNGAFTKALVEGLSGKADMSRSGRITHKNLDFYISERVKELTNGKQHPVVQASGGVPDFPIAVVK